jgi:hypothetical protein
VKTGDTNPFNSTYSQNSLGRLAAVVYKAPPAQGSSTCDTILTEQYNYKPSGLKVNKGVLITRTLQWKSTQGINPPVVSGPSTADLESVYTYDTEGRMTSVQYPGSTGGSAGPNLGINILA